MATSRSSLGLTVHVETSRFTCRAPVSHTICVINVKTTHWPGHRSELSKPPARVRLALGARAGSIVWLVIRETAWIVSGGIALGVALSYGAAGVMRSQFYGVDTYDPSSWLGAALIMVLTALGASAIPAGRAARVDPKVPMLAD